MIFPYNSCFFFICFEHLCHVMLIELKCSVVSILVAGIWMAPLHPFILLGLWNQRWEATGPWSPASPFLLFPSEPAKGDEKWKRKKRSPSACRPCRWARGRMSTWGRPACFSRLLCKLPLAKGLFRRSASSAGNWNWILWTTATSTAPWRLQSAHGRSNPCGPNWTKEPNKRFTTRIRPARAPG